MANTSGGFGIEWEKRALRDQNGMSSFSPGGDAPDPSGPGASAAAAALG
jgi:hypothetical protein